MGGEPHCAVMVLRHISRNIFIGPRLQIGNKKVGGNLVEERSRLAASPTKLQILPLTNPKPQPLANPLRS